jgi:hypothetical protein
MPRFVAKSFIVSAEQFTGDVAQWPDAFRRAVLRHLPGGVTEISTGDGPRPCRFSDWVVHGPGGFSVVHDAVFEACFAPVESVSSPDPEASAKRPAKK